MLFLVVPVVYQDRLEFPVLANIGALVVPVNGFQLFREENWGLVHVAHCFGQFMFGLVIVGIEHYILLWIA